ncbi:MAG: 16S rRNA (adenine(1518)-N(6)/adenine(1519)-N(6))-dimethyltransferase RsmA [Candidatus Diapherotrites archaeon]
MPLFNELQNLMIKYRFKPNKKLAQFFIIDDEFLEQLITGAKLTPDDVVLEIGAGTGFLTKKILEKCSVISYELDDNLCRLLETEITDKKLNLQKGNFLDSKIPKFTKIISLPPYTISSKIMYKILPLNFSEAFLVFQKEFIDKLTAHEGYMEYNALSVLTQYYTEPEILKTLSNESFFPKPKTHSAVIKLTKKKRFGTVKNEVLFEKFMKSLFRFQNKNLGNAMMNVFPFIEKDLGLTKAKFKKKIDSLELNEEKVNKISVKKFVETFNSLF